MLTLYDAARCPYCARDPHRPRREGHRARAGRRSTSTSGRRSIFELNPPEGRVPVLEEGTFVLPESAVINEYLEERYPEPALLPADPAERALGPAARRSGSTTSAIPTTTSTSSARPGRPSGSTRRCGRSTRRLEPTRILGGASTALADVAYIPWIFAPRRALASTSRALRGDREPGANGCSSGPRSRPSARSSSLSSG